MHVISVINKKGGVGKTTIASNLAQALAILGQKVLVIDNDAQHNLTSSVGISLRNCPSGLAEVLTAPAREVETAVQKSIYGGFLNGLDCIPGSKALESIKPRATALKEALNTKTVKAQKYDCVIIDNPPTISDNVRCAIGCSTHFLLPVQLKQFSISGLAELFRTLTVEYGIAADKIMMLRNMHKEGVKSRRVASESLAASYNENMLETVIPEDETFEKMVCDKKSMFLSRSKCKGTLVFQELVCEIFGFDRDDMMRRFEKELVTYRADMARENMKKRKIINLSLKEEV